MEEMWKDEQKVKPAMLVSLRVREQLVVYKGMFELIELLEELQGVKPMLQAHIEFLRKKLDERLDMIEESQAQTQATFEIVDAWKEMAYEDAPADKSFLSPENLAMRMQRRHKSN